MMAETAAAPTRYRYRVLSVFLSLAFLNYLDRICMARADEDVKSALRMREITPADETRMQTLVDQFVQEKGRAPDDAEREKIRTGFGEQLASERWSFVVSAFQLGYVLFEVPGGWMGDRWGVRMVIVRIVVWWSIFTALTGSSDTLVRLVTSDPSPITLVLMLWWVRFLFGVGEAGAYPNISRAMSRWFPASSRARVQGAMWLASRWGGAVSPLVYTYLLGVATNFGGSWRWVFWFLGALGIVWAVWFGWWYRNTPEETPGANDEECKLIRAGTTEGSIYDDHAHARVPWLRLFTSSNLIALYIAAFCSSFCWYFHSSQMRLYMKSVFGVGLDKNDWRPDFAMTAPLVGGGICCILGGVLSQWIIARTGSLRWGRALPGLIAFSAAAVCLLTVPYFNQQKNFWGAITCITLCFTLQDLHMAVLWSLTSDIGGRLAGTLAGNLNMLGNVGGYIGILVVPKIVLIGATFNEPAKWDNVFWMNGCIYIVGALMWLRINANEKLLHADDIVGRDPEVKR
jgi:ACS family glucarate transporter-like MFS transporter